MYIKEIKINGFKSFADNVNLITNRGFGSEVPVIVTSINGEVRGMSFYLSTFGKSFVIDHHFGLCDV